MIHVKTSDQRHASLAHLALGSVLLLAAYMWRSLRSPTTTTKPTARPLPFTPPPATVPATAKAGDPFANFHAFAGGDMPDMTTPEPFEIDDEISELWNEINGLTE
jgi:hypothetical protein